MVVGRRLVVVLVEDSVVVVGPEVDVLTEAVGPGVVVLGTGIIPGILKKANIVPDSFTSLSADEVVLLRERANNSA